MIKFKLCKMYNTVEIEYNDIEEIDVADLENIYNMLPECQCVEQQLTVEKPTEKQLELAKKLGINNASKMSKADLKDAIGERLNAINGNVKI